MAGRKLIPTPMAPYQMGLVHPVADSVGLLPKVEDTYDLPDNTAISAALIPMYEQPAARWTMQVIRVLGSMGVQHFKGPKISMSVIPLLLARLPPEVSELMPITTLQDALDYLLAYDARRPSWQIFSGVTLRGLKPSHALVRAVADLSAAWPGMKPEIYKEMGWDLVKSGLPEQLRTNLELATSVLPIEKSY